MARGLIKALPRDWKADYRFTTKSEGRGLRGLRNSNIHYDVIYSFLWHWTRRFHTVFNEWFPNTKLMVGVASIKKVGGRIFRNVMEVNISGVNTWCKNMYEYIKDFHPNVHLTRHGIDTEIFVPREKPLDEDFTVGWCGNILHSQKQANILRDLNFPILAHGRNLHGILGGGRREGRMEDGNIRRWTNRLVPYEILRDYYHSIHCLVCTSKSETGPLPVLEAASSGLPVVSTNVGIVPELLDEEWVIDECFDREIIAKEMNEKLAILADDSKLRRRVGRRNRKEILKYWTWNFCIDKWVEFFES